MTYWNDKKFFKKRGSEIFNSSRIPKFTNTFKAFVCAGIQIAGGTALAIYTYRNTIYPILPIMCSVITIGGSYNAFEIMLRNKNSIYYKLDKIQSTWELVNGAISYSAGIYAFSDGLKRDDKIWILYLAFAATGYYFCISAIDDMITDFNRSPLLTCCRLMSEPALIACASIFLLYFRDHEESCLYWLPFVLTGFSGYKIAREGLREVEYGDFKLLLIKVIKTLIGSFLLTFSSVVLTIYGTMHNFHFLLIASTTSVTFFGVFLIIGALTCFRRYSGIDQKIFPPLVGVIAGQLTFFCACLMIHFVEDSIMSYLIFLFLAGSSHFMLCRSLYKLHKIIHAPKLRKQSLRLLGPMMTVYSSLATACIAYRMNWWLGLVSAPFIPMGFYATYRGYRKEKRR